MATKTTIDSAGRLVIPIEVRKELALAPGTTVEVQIKDGEIRLRPASSGRLEKRAGRLILTAPLTGQVPDHRELREEHLERLTES